MSSEPKLLKDYSAEVKVAVPLLVEEGYKEVRAETCNGATFLCGQRGRPRPRSLCSFFFCVVVLMF